MFGGWMDGWMWGGGSSTYRLVSKAQCGCW